MERNQPAAAASLLDQEGKIIAEILTSYRDLVNFATEPITNKTSTGQASYNSMAMDLETQTLIKSVENLLSLTRRIRELWIVGPLRKPGEGDRTEETIESEVQQVVGILNQLRANKRQQLVSEGGGYGQFEMQLDGAAPTNTEAEPTGQVPERARTLKFDASRDSGEEAVRKGVELVRNDSDAPAERLGDTDGANAAQARGETKEHRRRKPKPAPLNLISFVPRITAPGDEGKTFGKESADDSTWPTFVVFTPTALSAAADAPAQDASADQEIDSPTAPIATDESSDSGSSLTSPTDRDGEAATEHSSVKLSPPSASANRKDEISGEEHVEEHVEERPQPTD
ncbi:hypothetical protein INS49_005853 [Diaporthe citri]|uniref:uncharacterized protein n=1 Tax=Diaporthe citri TaxID=83186 RepID=UPI001C7ED6CD|nr:uncharacterized protein INS49_005853 [Diaporthe citri]KAG6364254.1 hypothetical protein INS49_005853 [Diaporthe citri]